MKNLALAYTIEPMTTPTPNTPASEILEHEGRLDIRIVTALAGDRELNAREQEVVDKMQSERGESLFSDMLYALTHKTFPSRQAKTLWAEIGGHRGTLAQKLGRDPGITVATHDYLANVSGLIKGAGLIEEEKLTKLANSATRDGLTGLFDKTTFGHILNEETSRSLRYERPMTLVVADIDHFKNLNDTHGHADGDIVLTEVAQIIQDQCRTTDIPARVGGEEFAIVLAEVPQEAGVIFAERLRQAIEKHFQKTPYAVTMSLGVAGIVPSETETPDAIFRRGDAALYESKSGGRNKVSIARR